MNKCPICLDKFDIIKSCSLAYGGWAIDCEICGKYVIMKEAWENYLDPLTGAGHKLSEVCRARLAHKVRTAQPVDGDRVVNVTREIIKNFVESGCPGPSPAEQAKNLIRFIGDEFNKTGDKLNSLPDDLFSIIGAPSPQIAGELAIELAHRGLISGNERKTLNTPPSILHANLTLDGWEVYEEERRGEFSGDYGFIAMQFGDDVLDNFLREKVKPSIKEKIGYELIDMRDIAQAGIIDNIMRAQIRDAAFVLVDLTHDNPGAYWEAGYAEGLGKPVIYICEQDKFADAKTHFDTNHCTTVTWLADKPDHFTSELIATIRRSLDLFD